MPTSHSPRAGVSPELAAIELECYRGDNLLFSRLNFGLVTGQLMQIQGANGSGKTSLLRILAGLSRPSDGEVHWRGRNIQAQRGEYFSEMAYLGHSLGIKGELSALENLKVSSALADVCFNRDSIESALAEVGLAGREDIPARTLSAGQKQRIALARLLASASILWILDEPFTALDVAGVALMRRLLEDHLAQGGMAVLTSHQAIEVQAEVVKVSLS